MSRVPGKRMPIKGGLIPLESWIE